MTPLLQIIYRSTAKGAFDEEELTRILAASREKNAALGITGVLLYSEGTFFQVLEGEAAAVDDLMARIAGDSRHGEIVTIVREPIARRSFADWTMGYAKLTPTEVRDIVGVNDFFQAGTSLNRIEPGRAKKLLAAFHEGRWRSRLSGRTEPPAPAPAEPSPAEPPAFTFAFQPIVDASARTVVSYEALIRGKGGEPAAQVLQMVNPVERRGFDEVCRAAAVDLASRLGLDCDLDLNFLPLCGEVAQRSIASTLEAARRCAIPPDRIVLEILESEIISDHDGFVRAVNDYRALGLKTAIDDFGAGYAGLALLAEFLPDIIKIDMNLIRDVERKGPRQAIVRGVVRTCLDLGIDVIAEGVETEGEQRWLLGEGIHLFQGNLFAEPAFERLPPATFLPD